jgi:hypothetical protein
VVFNLQKKKKNQKNKTLGEKYKEAYKLWREGNPVTRRNIDAKTLLNQKN